MSKGKVLDLGALELSVSSVLSKAENAGKQTAITKAKDAQNAIKDARKFEKATDDLGKALFAAYFNKASRILASAENALAKQTANSEIMRAASLIANGKTDKRLQTAQANKLLADAYREKLVK